MISNNIASLLQTDPSSPSPIAVRQGVVQAWDADTGENSIQIAGGTIVNIPSLTAEAAELVAGDVVAVLTSGDTALVLGKVTTPGDPGTVPTWNADLTALAPLVDLAAVTTGTTVTGATLADPEITAPEFRTADTGQRIEISSPTFANLIRFFTTDTVGGPGQLAVGGDGTNGYVELVSPQTDTGAIARINLGSVAGASYSNWEATDILVDADTQVDISTPSLQWNGSDLVSKATVHPYFHAYLNASQAITTAGAAQKVTGWVADGSPNSSEVTHSSGNFTVPRDGRYRLRAQAWWAAVASPTGVRTAQWVKNPSTLLASHTVPGNSATVPMPVYVEKTVRLVANDQVFLQVIQGQANGHQLIGSTPDITYAQIEWVGP
jgi:hypothetical protein